MADKLITLSVMFASMVYLFEAKHLTFGSMESPKTGFLPILAGVTALLLSLAILIGHMRSAEEADQEPVDWTKFIFVIIGLLFYIIILISIGYFAATLILLFYLFKVADTAGWLFPLLLAAVSSIACYLLFAYYLAIPLP